jgi:ankyrin repeat protein
MEFVNNNDNDEVASDENIWVAASDGNIVTVKTLIETGVHAVNEQDGNGYSAIHAAASYGHEELIRYLISIGANVNLKDNDGDTPILLCEEPEIFTILKSYGADPTAVNDLGQGIFEKVVEDENDVMIRFLVTEGIVDSERAEIALKQIDNIIEEGDEGDDDDEEGDDEEGDGEEGMIVE